MIAEELGRGLADTAFLGPTLAADLRRRAGAPPASARRDRRLRGGPVAAGRARSGRRSMRAAVDARGARFGAAPPHRSTAAGRLGVIDLGDEIVGADLTRPVARRPGRCAGAALVTDRRGRWTTRTWRAGRASGWRWRAPTSSAPCGARSTLATEYATERKQYGAAIGSFQAVQHLLADAHVAMEGSRQHRAARSLGGGRVAGGRGLGRLPRRPRRTAPAPPARCARRRSRCTAASATPGSAWPTSSCAGRCSRPRSSAASAPNLQRVLAARGIGGDDGLR